ncbi:membrane protein-like protein [Verminephrobacter eiseniae EF01-2]|uniref:Membrane protein-like protein n=1 Tax=Verminephrobacter eiseniae (strain EF01-2) TaxID=391735 RepID=A1WFG4_VEREI|nr:membrane protein-like protein [Verminephrobacter eiseniae EF01-2]
MPFFIGAVIIAHMLGAGQTLLDILALVYVMLRIAYVGLYVADMPTARSAVWAGGFLANSAIFLIGYR